jgi:hypothetical protein
LKHFQHAFDATPRSNRLSAAIAQMQGARGERD